MHAVSRLLGVAVEAREPTTLRTALVREARAYLGATWAVLLAVEGEDDVRVVAAEPAARPAPAEPPPLPPVAVAEITRALAERRAAVALAGAEAAACAPLFGGEPAVALVLPLRTHGTPHHVLVLGAATPEPFGADERDVAVAFANAAAGSLAQLRLADEHAAEVAKLSALARAAKTLNVSLDLGRTLEAICRESRAILDGDNAVIYAGDPESGVRIEAVSGLAPESIGYVLAPGAGLAGKVIQFDRPMLTNDYGRIAELPPDSPFADVQSCLAVPMHWDGGLRGVLAVGYHRRRRVGGDELRLLETFAELASVAFANATAHAGLAQAARSDGLTGCLNHAAMQEALAREVERVGRTGGSLAFALLDLDHFKAINERHGHLVGDEVLRRVGHALRHAVRPYDLVARYGGDEFALVLPGADEGTALEIARRASTRLAAAIEDIGDGLRAGHATVGVAAWEAGISSTELIDRADRALLAAKRADRRGTIERASLLPPDDAEPPSREPAVRPRTAHASRLWPADPHAQTERLRRRTRQLAMANALGARLAAMTDVGSIIDAAADELHRAFGFFCVAVIRLRDDGYVESAAGRGEAFERLTDQGWCQPASAGLIGRCLRERRVVLVNDVFAEGDYRETPETGEVRSELVAPLYVAGHLWGAINVEEATAGAFDDDDALLLQTVADQVGSALRSGLLYERLDRAYLGTAEALATALEAKDAYTADHARQIVEHAEAVGRALGLRDQALRDLRYGAVFHDIGKIAVPEAILNKRGPLSPEEWEVVERHTVIGEQILAPVEFLARVLPLVRHEHERWDGTGYPDRLAGEAIPLGARIILVCDSWHAMTSDRAYRPAMTPEEAVAELRRGAGTQFDPRVVDTFLRVVPPVALPAGLEGAT